MKKIVVSSNNEGKIKEIEEILHELNFEILKKSDMDLDGVEVEETGDTLEQNAMLKARALKNLLSDEYLVLADDTGLYVDYLDGKPGLYTARFAGEHATDEDNRKKLLKELEGVEYEKRTAYFKTAIALVEDGKREIITEGICKGHIAEEERGEHGFGYDFLFIPEGYDKTFSELEHDIKNSISHRRRALENLKTELIKLK